MMSLKRPSLARRALSTTPRGHTNNGRVPVHRQLSILSSPRRHACPRPITHHSRLCLPIRTWPERCYSSDSAAILATSTHVPTEQMMWYNPAQYVMDVAHIIHDTTGWPYATCIVIITAMGRSALFPLMVSSQRVAIKRHDIQNALQRFSKTKPTKQALEAKQKALRQHYGYHPSQHFTLPLANVALTCYMWFGLRWMGFYYPDELSTGGFLWFTDLTQSDPIHLLPILSGTASILMFEVGTDFREMSSRRKLFGRVVAFTLIPILMFASASVHIFWTSNWLMSALQDVIISQPAVRDKLGLVKAIERKGDSIKFFKDAEKDENDKANNKEKEGVETVVIPRKVRKGVKQKKKKPVRR